MKFHSCVAGFFVPVLLGLVVASCSGGGGGGGGGGAVAPPAQPPVAPSGLSYSTPAALYSTGTAIAPNTATLVTGTSVTYTIIPALPAGLVLNAATGTISGTPALAQTIIAYVVTATNSEGAAHANLSITITAPAPNTIGYTTPVAYLVGRLITPNAPANHIANSIYSVNPALPAGLTLGQTGTVTGTPQGTLVATDFTITQITPTSGTRVSVVRITITHDPPDDLEYDSPVTYYKGITIPPNMPVITGGSPVTSFSIAPPLPVSTLGLSLDTVTGVLSGTPLSIHNKNYTISATNGGGTTTFVLTLVVTNPVECDLAYDSPISYALDVTIADNVPIIEAGCDFDSYTVTPALPVGLALDAQTGVISGTPTQLTSTETYTIDATGVGGFVGHADVVITIQLDFEIACESVGATFSQATGVGSFDVSLTIEEDSDNGGFPNDIAAYSLGLAHDGSLLEAVTILEGADSALLRGGTGVQFFGPSIYDAGITIGVIVVFDFTESLVADAPKEVAVITYNTVESEFIGRPTSVTTGLTWVDTLGPTDAGGQVTTPIVNLVDSEGSSHSPVRIHGTVELSPVP